MSNEVLTDNDELEPELTGAERVGEILEFAITDASKQIHGREAAQDVYEFIQTGAPEVLQLLAIIDQPPETLIEIIQGYHAQQLEVLRQNLPQYLVELRQELAALMTAEQQPQ